ncbi:unnamed protein product [Schistocephalus solidus]|uniref:EF-hand domain-containing protein n=1 Tax=Schistocephalus solidus TaxID=70667 RepID=A0A3P7CB94_SCHSO|nr:unnamed protein product [Schistocephalus solidus]
MKNYPFILLDDHDLRENRIAMKMLCFTSTASSLTLHKLFQWQNSDRRLSAKQAAGLSKAEVDDIREVFDLFDFWDGRDGMVDASKVPDLLRCTGINPTNAVCLKNGACRNPGEIQYKFEEFLSVYQAILRDRSNVTKAMFTELFRTFDRESQGLIDVAQLRAVLVTHGERLSEKEVDEVFTATGVQQEVDGHIKYEGRLLKVDHYKDNAKLLSFHLNLTIESKTIDQQT